MIDDETAFEWAKAAGFSCETGFYCSNTSSIQALITRAQSEAFEQAAQACENKEVWNMDDPGETAAYTIRSLKFKEPIIQGKIKMKPFNLKKAKAGAPVITRDGRTDWEFVTHVPQAGANQRLLFLRKRDGIIFVFREDGTTSDNEKTGPALFMAEEKPIVRWLWATSDGKVLSRMYSEEELKERQKDNSVLSLYTTKLEWTRTEFSTDGGAK